MCSILDDSRHGSAQINRPIAAHRRDDEPATDFVRHRRRLRVAGRRWRLYVTRKRRKLMPPKGKSLNGTGPRWKARFASSRSSWNGTRVLTGLKPIMKALKRA